MSSDWLGVSIAPNDTMFVEEPDWVRLDTGIEGLRVNGIQIRRGKTTEFEQTGTGTCTVSFNDTQGVLDPTNVLGDFYGLMLSRPFAFALRNPITDEWFPLFRGVVDDVQHSFNRSVQVRNTTITAVDMLDYFANFELIPGLAGFSNAKINADGYVFYEDAGFDERVTAILVDANVPDGLKAVFTGNVFCSESRYSSGDKVLQALQEACDAEFPTVANYYIDKTGIVQVHGRRARFDPETTAASADKWDFHRWKAGDNEAASADIGATGTAKMQEPYSFRDSRSDIRNAALAYPQDTDQSDLLDFIYTDEASRDEHGTRTWTAPNMQVESEVTIPLSAKAFCQRVSQYMVENYADPVPRISQLTIGTEHPDWEFADASWALMCGVDISDVIAVTIGHPGAGGFEDEDYFVEGLSYDIRPGPGSLDESFPIVKMSADLTAASRWTADPFV